MKVKSESEVAQSCPALSNPTDCSLPGSSVHGISRQEYWSGLPLPSPKNPLNTLYFLQYSFFPRLVSLASLHQKQQNLTPDHFLLYTTGWLPRERLKSHFGLFLDDFSSVLLVSTNSPNQRTAIKKGLQIPPLKTGQGMDSRSCLLRALCQGRR